MTIQRRIYYRKKNKSIIIEGKQKGKTIYLLSLPKDPEQLIRFLGENLTPLKFTKKASFLTKDKYTQIMEKITRLDYKSRKDEDEV